MNKATSSMYVMSKTIVRLREENEDLWAFYHAWEAVEQGINDFDLRNQQVEELREAAKRVQKREAKR